MDFMSTDALWLVAAISASLIVGALAAWLIMRPKVAKAFTSGQIDMAPEIERLNQELERLNTTIHAMRETLSERSSQLKQSEDMRHTLNVKLAVSEQKGADIPELKTAVAQRDRQLQQLHEELKRVSTELATEAERTSRLKAVTAKLEQHERTIGDLMEALSRKKVAVSELETRIAEERKQAAEKLALLNEARTELTNQFRVLAQEILDEKGKAFGEQSAAGLKTLLDPFRDQLSEFRKKVSEVYVEEAKERTSLKKEIEILRDLNQQISQEAVNLTRALKGDKKAQGTWGELILERVLEKSGLRKGVEYETQGTFRDAAGHLLRPDVIVHLPDDKSIVIDSKVSLIAYERYANAESEEVRAKALAEHLQAVRTHVQSLSAKGYADLKGIRSLDYILMFMPIEAAFVAAFREDEALYAYAFDRHIIIVTPSTLLATLKTIENIWRFERQSRNAQAVFERAAAIYDKLRLFLESMEKLGKQMDSAHGTYDDAMNRLVRGKGNVISQLSRFSELGISVKKELPASITEVAETEISLPIIELETVNGESES